MYKITAYTEDGQVIEFPASPNEDVVTSALKQDVILLMSCREGGCATCKAECTDGEYEMANASVQALPPDEEENGFVLLCCTYPRSNLTLNLPIYIRPGFVREEQQGMDRRYSRGGAHVVQRHALGDPPGRS